MTSAPSTGEPANRERAALEDLVTLTIDDIEVTVPKDTLVIRAAELMGTEIPRFCDHPLLDPIAACRQCLVEVPDAGNGREMPKPQPACALTVAPGMVVRTATTSHIADKAQRGNLEFLLINHPLDCPVCDKGGECPLQNQSQYHGDAESRYIDAKRTFRKPIEVSKQILLDRERCVMCYRCTRFSDEIAGDPFIEMFERGPWQEVAKADGHPFHSYFSGNTVQICPVGALTSADYRFRSRPFDLVSTPSIAEHDACGSAIRIDWRRGKVMRRLAGDDPAVNEEWITDKDRFAFRYPTLKDRLTVPLVRNADSGELEPMSWPGALEVAARGLRAAAGNTGVLPGGRLTAEDAYAYSKFARTVLGTNDIDFRSRPHSTEEEQFLAAAVAGAGTDVTFTELEHASRVVLAGFDAEDEAGMVFLRLRKGMRKRNVRVQSIASHVTRGLEKMGGELIATTPGKEAEAIDELDLGAGDILVVGERLATIPGALSAALRATAGDARLAWIPRRAGDRGAADMGCLPGLLPGGRPIADAEARHSMAPVWSSIPETPGRDLNGIIEALRDGDLSAAVVAGVEPDDLPDPAAALQALEAADFVVSLEVRHSQVTERADVVLPVAAPVQKSGTFVNWEGRPRSFETVLEDPGVLTDIRVLSEIAKRVGTKLGLRTAHHVRTELDKIGPWTGGRGQAPTVAVEPRAVPDGHVILSTWRQQIDDGRGQDGMATYKATARPAVIRASQSTLTAAGIRPGDMGQLATDAGRVALPTLAVDMPDGVVWAPTNSAGWPLRRLLKADHGDVVRLETTDILPPAPQSDMSQENRAADNIRDVAGAYYVEGDGVEGDGDE